jgi:hypothetical protein
MSVGADLLRFSDRKLLFWDQESSCLNIMQSNLPFQCTWLIADRHHIHSTHNYYLKWPNFRMSADAATITHFQQSWVDNGDDPEFVLDVFEGYLFDPQYLIIGHSILAFDSALHQLWRRALGRKPDYSYLTRIIDTHLISRAMKKRWKPDRSSPEAFLAWQYKVADAWEANVKTNLGLMAEELGVTVDKTKQHDALYDLAGLNYGVYKGLIQKVEI